MTLYKEEQETSNNTRSLQMESSSLIEMNSAVEILYEHKDAWLRLPIKVKMSILSQMIHDYGHILDRWVGDSLEAKGAVRDPYAAGLEWISGPVPILRYLQGLRHALADIEIGKVPAFPGPVSQSMNGQVVAQIYPNSLYERIVTPGVTVEVWMDPTVTLEELAQTQAIHYKKPGQSGSITLVLGAGNVSAIPVLDSLYKLFVEQQVVLLKMNPVNEYLGPLIIRGFQRLIEQGYLQVVYGGAVEGSYLCQHSHIDEIHVTGSDKTYEAILYGSGADGRRRKLDDRPLLSKRFTSELGSVSPVIIVPGPWSARDLYNQAELLASHICDNAGFSCSRGRVIVNQDTWPLRDQLIQDLRLVLDAVSPRRAYYPGAFEQYKRFVSEHPEAEMFGRPLEGQLPWTLIPGIESSDNTEICFTTESFCPVISETTIRARTIPEYLDRAVDFTNNGLWGTLSATIVVHPRSLKDPEISNAIEKAISNLRVGVVVLNGLPGMVWAMASPPWGSYPGNERHDIQSGTGFVNNAYMFPQPEKVVARVPFNMFPKPIWFPSRARAYEAVAKKVAFYALKPKWWKIPGIMMAAFRR